MEDTSPSQIKLHGHTFFKCCATWDRCKCGTNDLTDSDKKYRLIKKEDVETFIMYNKYQDYSKYKRTHCPSISFGDFISGNFR